MNQTCNNTNIVIDTRATKNFIPSYLCTQSARPTPAVYTLDYQAAWKKIRIIVDALIHFPNKSHDHERAYLLKTCASFRLRCDIPNGELPEPPMRPDVAIVDTNFQKYTWWIEVYNKHMKVNCTTVKLLRKLFPDGLVKKKYYHPIYQQRRPISTLPRWRLNLLSTRMLLSNNTNRPTT